MATLTCGGSEQAGVDWMTVAGELDAESTGRLELELAGMTERVVVVDLRDVEFIDAAGVTALLRARRAAAEEGREVLLLAGPRVQRVLGIVGLGQPAGWPDDDPAQGLTRWRAARRRAEAASLGLGGSSLLSLDATPAPEVPDDGDGHVARERSWWDQAYTDSPRRRVQPFYSIQHGRRSLYRRLCMNAAAGPGRRALELGATSEGVGMELARSGTDVLAIDVSQVAVEQARRTAAAERLDDIRFERMDAESLDLPDGEFDLVCGSAIIHHLDLEAAIPEVVRVLRPDGVAVFTEPLGHNPMLNAFRRRTPTMRTPDEHPLLMSDLDMLREHFGEVEVEWFHLTSLAAVPFANTPVMPPLMRSLERLDRRLFRHERVRRHAWYVVLRLARPLAPGADPSSSAARLPALV
jgi:anti-anti-sigma factor